MKKLKILVLIVMTITFYTSSLISQEEDVDIEVVEEDEMAQDFETLTATFDGIEGSYYSFNFTNEEGESDTIFFNEVAQEVLESYDLKDDEFIGQTFVITYNSVMETEIDDDGDEQELQTRTIIDLKLKN